MSDCQGRSSTENYNTQYIQIIKKWIKATTKYIITKYMYLGNNVIILLPHNVIDH